MRIVELSPDEGHLPAALLKRFPTSRMLALDRSEAMWARTGHDAGSNVNRLEVRDFDLLRHDWHGFDSEPVNAVVTSLTAHHLEGAGKFHLFKDLFVALAPGEIFVLTYLTEPPSRVGL